MQGIQVALVRGVRALLGDRQHLLHGAVWQIGEPWHGCTPEARWLPRGWVFMPRPKQWNSVAMYSEDAAIVYHGMSPQTLMALVFCEQQQSGRVHRSCCDWSVSLWGCANVAILHAGCVLLKRMIQGRAAGLN